MDYVAILNCDLRLEDSVKMIILEDFRCCKMYLPKLPPLYFYPLVGSALLPVTFLLSYTIRQGSMLMTS